MAVATYDIVGLPRVSEAANGDDMATQVEATVYAILKRAKEADIFATVDAATGTGVLTVKRAVAFHQKSFWRRANVGKYVFRMGKKAKGAYTKNGRRRDRDEKGTFRLIRRRSASNKKKAKKEKTAKVPKGASGSSSKKASKENKAGNANRRVAVPHEAAKGVDHAPVDNEPSDGGEPVDSGYIIDSSEPVDSGDIIDSSDNEEVDNESGHVAFIHGNTAAHFSDVATFKAAPLRFPVLQHGGVNLKNYLGLGHNIWTVRRTDAALWWQ